jgi:hypothetical protein
MNVSRTALVAAVTLALSAIAQAAPPASGVEFSHAGGFVCGNLGAPNNRIVGGDHRTHFNIRNGSHQTLAVKFDLALGFPSADPAANGASFTPGATTTLPTVLLAAG